jgi:drug/metabolite transporter (DMT)-like permease
MIINGKLRWKLLVGLIAAIAFDTMLQIVWKTAVIGTPEVNLSMSSTLSAFFANPLFLGVIAIMTLQFFNWLMVLAEADLSYAKPIASLSFASVPVTSVLLLHEAFDAVEVAGVLCVIAGVFFISQTKPLTSESNLSSQPETP